MALVQITTSSFGSNTSSQRPKAAYLKQLGGSGLTLTFPYAPKEIRFSADGLKYVEIDRPGLHPILDASAVKLRATTFTVVLADRASFGELSMEAWLERLSVIAGEDEDIQFVNGVRALPYRARITDFSTQSIRHDLNGNIIQASVTITLTERVPFEQEVSNLSPIQYSPPASPLKSSSGGSDSETTIAGLKQGFSPSELAPSYSFFRRSDGSVVAKGID